MDKNSINNPPRRGIEPRSPAWQAGILTTILPRMNLHGRRHVLSACSYKFCTKWIAIMENLGIDPSASRMQSERSSIWANSPFFLTSHVIREQTQIRHTIVVHIFINNLCNARNIQQSGAEEACWAHNPEVGGSKPPSATSNFCCYTLRYRACPGVEPGTSHTRSANHTTRPTGHTNTKFHLLSSTDSSVGRAEDCRCDL